MLGLLVGDQIDTALSKIQKLAPCMHREAGYVIPLLPLPAYDLLQSPCRPSEGGDSGSPQPKRQQTAQEQIDGAARKRALSGAAEGPAPAPGRDGAGSQALHVPPAPRPALDPDAPAPVFSLQQRHQRG